MTIWQPFQLFLHTNDAHLSNCFILETNACIFIITSRARLWLYHCSSSQCCRINWHFYVICDEININIFSDIMSACFCSSIRPDPWLKLVKKSVICNHWVNSKLCKYVVMSAKNVFSHTKESLPDFTATNCIQIMREF